MPLVIGIISLQIELFCKLLSNVYHIVLATFTFAPVPRVGWRTKLKHLEEQSQGNHRE